MINIYRVRIMKTLNINIAPNYYLIIMEDGGRGRQSMQGARGRGYKRVWSVCAVVWVMGYGVYGECVWKKGCL